ncbi:3,4-dioxygenase subunit beta [Agromyces sp. MMS24-JH15]|uniref:dioxygenase family protein n=1 Tax=Agromyces sp. MMS24-JH15 TaxID=3243765 RepID=UPI003749C52D
MRRIPEPERTARGPAYEGRLLDRPDDEVVDQGAGFDVRTLLTRRRLLGLIGLGAGTLALAACTPSADGATDGSAGGGAGAGAGSATGASEGEIPEETNGPYPADGTADLNILERSGIVRSDIRPSLDGGMIAEGVTLAFTFTVTDVANGGAPFAGVAVYAWQCDAQGRYSMYTEGVEDETFLRGIQVTDANGAATFTTIVPGCYQGRWTHLHFEVYPDLASATKVSNVIATSQAAFPPEMLGGVYALDAYAGSARNLAGVGTAIADDGIFGDGDWTLQVPTITGSAGAGYVGALAVAIDTATTPGGGGMGGPGGPGGGPRGSGGAR